MNGVIKFLKVVVIFYIVTGVISIVTLWFQTFVVGAYYAHSGPFLAIITGFSPIFALIVAFWAIRVVIDFKPSNLEG